jgi:dynactin-6
LTPTETVQAGEQVQDFTVLFGNGQRRRDKTMEGSEDSRAQRVKAQEKHVEMLKRLIPDGKAKWLD